MGKNPTLRRIFVFNDELWNYVDSINSLAPGNRNIGTIT